MPVNSTRRTRPPMDQGCPHGAFSIFPLADDEVLDGIPPNHTAASLALDLARALGCHIWLCPDVPRIEIDGLSDLPDRVRSTLSVALVVLCRSLLPILEAEAGIAGAAP